MKELLVSVCGNALFMGLNTMHEAVINERLMMSHGSYAEIPKRGKALNELCAALKERYGDSWDSMSVRYFLSDAQQLEVENQLDAMMDQTPYTKPEFLL